MVASSTGLPFTSTRKGLSGAISMPGPAFKADLPHLVRDLLADPEIAVKPAEQDAR
jgi:hypothetical protein